MTESNLPAVVSRAEWTAARKDLLTSEKEAVRAKDALNTRRRELPMVRVEKDYRFAGGAYGILDMTALGRQENWEEPKGRTGTSRGAIPDFG